MERDTRQRAAIRSAIETAARPLAPHEVLDLARTTVPQMNLATVYRNLKAMQAEGIIAVVRLPGESARYEPNHLAHHHHFQCDGCKRVYDIHGCTGEMLHSVPSGFLVARHELTLYGLCDACSPQRRALGKLRPVPSRPATT
ncbi:MAG: transcriptional repressor [Betaproteobacteria bacterium]|nr:MAG: transcriptional repressor [Betaproteobacteria bacterium]